MNTLKTPFDNLSLWRLNHFALKALFLIQRLSFPGASRVKRFLRKRIFDGRYIRTPYLGRYVYVCPTHIMGETVFEGGIHEPEVMKAIQAFVSSGYSFIDLGANIGLHTMAAAFVRKDEGQTFISFEPDTDIYAVLKRNCEGNHLGFVDCRQEGVGDQDSFLNLYVSTTHNKGRNSFLPIESSTARSHVKLSRLDTLFLNDVELTKKNILIKMDVEGYELPVIKGGLQWLSRIDNLAVICEIWPELMERNGLAVSELYACMEQCGFAGHKFFTDGRNVIFYKGEPSETLVRQLALYFK